MWNAPQFFEPQTLEEAELATDDAAKCIARLEYLKHLYILDQPHNLHVAPTDAALQQCFASDTNAELFAGTKFAEWVLGDWLPFHLRYHHCKVKYAEAERLAREMQRDDAYA